MPSTGIVGPLNNAAVGTGLGDGTNYTAWIQPQRLHRTSTGASAAVVTAANRGTRWYNIFDSNQIPTGATVQGVEIVAGTDFDGSGNSNIGTFGSTGSTESISLRAFLYNGTSYSSALTYDGNSRSGFVYSDNDTTATITGANKRYLGFSTLGTLFGGAADLSGLTWDPADQADWGFAFVSTAVTQTPVAGAIRGIGLRVTYIGGAAGPSNVAQVNGVVKANIDEFNGIVLSGISEISSID